jgi:hypothetical protein
MFKTNSIFANSFLFILFVMLSCSVAKAQFTADLVQTESGNTKTGKFYFKKPFYRMDLEEQEEKFYVIVNRKEKISRIIRPSKKAFIEINSTGMNSVSNDIFQSIEKQNQMYKTKMVGTETLNNFKCKKYIVMIDSNIVTTYWKATAINFPIKAVTGKNKDKIMELKNITKGDVDDSYFLVPEGYKKMEIPGVK